MFRTLSPRLLLVTMVASLGLISIPTATTVPDAQARTNCSSFKSQAAAQRYYRKTRKVALDRDKDGIACETRPKPYDHRRVLVR